MFRSRAPAMLFALTAVFVLPLLAAWTLARHPEWLPATRVNHGQLIQPPVATELKGQWTLLVPVTERCDAECRRVRAVALVVRRALGVRGERVRVPDGCGGALLGVCMSARAALGAGVALVIVDPAGFVMLRYGPEVAPRDLLRDVLRLLKGERYWRHDGA